MRPLSPDFDLERNLVGTTFGTVMSEVGFGMRRRKHQRGISVLAGCFVLSLGLHAFVALPLRDVFDHWMTAKGNAPVGVVSLSAEDWNRTLRAARAVQRLQRPASAQNRQAASPTRTQPSAIAPPPAAPKPPEPKPAERVHGQIVEVPPTPDASPNPDAKYLSKHNTHVERETVARVENRDPSRRRVTNELQTREVPGAPDDAPRTPGLTVGGNAGHPARPPADQGAKRQTAEKSRLALKIPSMERRETLNLKLMEGPGLLPGVPKQTGTDPVKGNADHLELSLGEDIHGTRDPASGRTEADDQGGNENAQPSVPSLNGLVPTLGTVARISGSPSRDHVDGLPEGDGTFLNTKEFKYATFFYRVRDSVANHWEGLAAREYRRRDPTGNIYGVKDRATLLEIRLTPEGRLDDVHVARTSGVDFLDQVAMQAFQLAQPFPNPPPGIADTDGRIRFNFQFVVTMGSRSPLNLFNFR